MLHYCIPGSAGSIFDISKYRVTCKSLIPILRYFLYRTPTVRYLRYFRYLRYLRYLRNLRSGVEIVGVRQSDDCQKFGRTAEDGVSGSPTDTRQIREYFYHFLFTMSIYDNGNDPYWSSRKRSSRTYRITNQLLEINVFHFDLRRRV